MFAEKILIRADRRGTQGSTALFMKFFTLFSTLLCTLILTGCSSLPEAGMAYDQADGWYNQLLHGKTPRKIVIRLGEQKAELYSNNVLIGESPVSTGREGYNTPPGKYRVLQKDADHHSNLYGNYVVNGKVVVAGADIRKDPKPPGAKFVGAPMPYFIRFYQAYGLHEGYLPGYAASSGCVRMPMRQARRFYHAVEIGTPVVVTR